MNLKKTSGFKLHKWFLDVIDDTGEVAIGYVADLWWRGLHVPYTDITVWQGEKVVTQNRFRKPCAPHWNNGNVEWKDDIFKIRGQWEKGSEAISTQLYKDEEGLIDWQCFLPLAKASLQLADGTDLKGKGYVELLTLTVPPWKIPMKQLRWGRFHSGTGYLVWIDLAGVPGSRWLWHNGKLLSNPFISDRRIEVPEKNLALEIQPWHTLEAEKKILQVVASLVKYLPGFHKILPGPFLSADENKWLSKGQLYLNNRLEGQGWVIHELLDFEP